MKKWLTYLAFIGLGACAFDEDPNLPSVEERVEEAIDDLEDKLVDPNNGWVVNYQPNSGGGSFIILMDFSSQGTVRIQSDLVTSDEDFRDQTIPYRIDSGQGLELILETYGIFHYFFELNRATFGGDFEFEFVEESNDGSLIFVSKSDFSVIVFEPASFVAGDLLSSDQVNQLSNGNFFQSTTPAGSFAPYNIYIPSDNVTISLTLDLDARRMKVHGAAEGATLTDFGSTANQVNVNAFSTYRLESNSVRPNNPISFSLNGKSYDLSSIPIANPSETFESFCDNPSDTLAQFSSSASFGAFTMTSNLAQTHSSFTQLIDNAYSVNGPVIFDEQDNRISDRIQSIFSDEVVATLWYYGLELQDGSLLNAIGFVTVDDFNNTRFYLREYELTLSGNLFQLEFVDNFFANVDPPAEQIEEFEVLIAEIFDGGEVYMLEPLTSDGIYEYFNPCNNYKGIIFGP